jgi:hypothetical protein
MTHLDTPRRRTRSDRRSDLPAQTVAASALAGGCLAVVALWKSATANGATGRAPR